MGDSSPSRRRLRQPAEFNMLAQQGIGSGPQCRLPQLPLRPAGLKSGATAASACI